MKLHLPLLLRPVLVLAVWTIGCPAQDLPGTVLELPPLPTLASSPALSRPAGLPGGPAPVYVPISHLTLPEKPSVAHPTATFKTERSSTPPVDELAAPQENAPVPDDLLTPSNHPLLPSSGTLHNSSPEGVPDLLPSPEDPVAAGFIEIESTPDASSEAVLPAPPSTAEPGPVAPSDLAPAPDKTSDTTDPAARGPIFRVKGGEAVNHTRPLGYRFTPAMGMGRRDGIHTVASQVPNILTSEVHGPRMMQLRPSPLWTTPYIENTFYMFCDPAYSAVRLQPGWKLRGIQLKGPNWQWVVCPKSGANTASFSIRVRAWKTIDTPTQGSVVTLEGLTLEGPPGATDWKSAFPSLLRSPALAAQR